MVHKFRGFELDDTSFELRAHGERVRVEPKVLDLLFLLVQRHPALVTKREIFESVWTGVRVSEASLARAVMEARRAIGDDAQDVIVTVRGRGFRFAGELEGSGASTPSAPREAAVATRPPLVGREAHVAALVARLDDADAGRGSHVWISGEAGSGKTRLADEIAERARARGALVLAARCAEDADSPALWPWREIARAHDDVTFKTELDARISSPETGHFDRMEACWRAFAASVERAGRTVVVILDDLQWADLASLELLLFGVRQQRTPRLLIVSASRDGAPRSDEHAKLAGKLVSDGGTLYLPLRALSADDVARFTAQATGREISHDMATRLRDRSSGNPLFLTQLLETEWARRALSEPTRPAESSIDLKPELLASISRHVDGVTAECRALLDAASVLGVELATPALAAAAGMAVDDALELVDEAMRARILAKGKTGGYRFAHPLVREALYKGLAEPARVALHNAVGEALLAQYGDAAHVHAAELARHFGRAGSKRATEWAKRAAEAAEAHGAHADSAKLYEQAIATLGASREASAQSVELRIALAGALGRAGDPHGARDALLDAAVLAKACRLPEALGRIEALLA
jgi:predicted ATPase/DNA-binding winged helix-turn-helix (wHTH) protein